MRKIVVIPLAVAIVAVGTTVALVVSHHSSPPPVTAQCRHDMGVWNGFVGREVAAGYPDVPVMDGFVVLQFARDEMRILRKDCPATVKVRVLPG